MFLSKNFCWPRFCWHVNFTHQHDFHMSRESKTRLIWQTVCFAVGHLWYYTAWLCHRCIRKIKKVELKLTRYRLKCFCYSRHIQWQCHFCPLEGTVIDIMSLDFHIGCLYYFLMGVNINQYTFFFITKTWCPTVLYFLLERKKNTTIITKGRIAILNSLLTRKHNFFCYNCKGARFQ